MSFDTIRQEITTGDETALCRLIAYAVVLQDRKSGQLCAELARKLDDPERARRVDWKSAFAKNPAPCQELSPTPIPLYQSH